MRRALLGWVALFAVTPVIVAGSMAQAASNPVRLTDAQLDAVTAGAVVVVAIADAVAVGDITKTLTVTNAGILTTKNGTVIGRAVARASASACCGSDADAAAFTDTFGSGGRVVVDRTRTITRKTLDGGVIVTSFSILVIIDRPLRVSNSGHGKSGSNSGHGKSGSKSGHKHGGKSGRG